jgi:diguanylate cyclase (GGDEF)-like protein
MITARFVPGDDDRDDRASAVASGATPEVSAPTRPPPARPLVRGAEERRRVGLLLASFARILNSEVALFYQPDGGGGPLPVISSTGQWPGHEEVTRPHQGGFVGRALGAQRAALVPLRAGEELIDAADGVRLTHAVVAPVSASQETMGWLVAAFSTAPEQAGVTEWATESCAAMLALCLQQPTALEALLQADRYDSLTGCLTYLATREELDREINRSNRANLSLSLCFIDLDNFKAVNDQHGHLRGNEVLSEAAHVLHSSVRSCDTLGRFGGDEFIAILPETTPGRALRLAARLRANVVGVTVSPGGEPLTASVGVAHWTPGTTGDQLLAQADHAMRRAKAQRARPRLAQSETDGDEGLRRVQEG